MAVTPKWYLQGMAAIMRGDVLVATDDLFLSLHTSTYAPNLDTHDFFNDATNELGATAGYPAGGIELTGAAISTDAASDQARLDFADPTFPFSGTRTWRYGVVRKARGGASSADELVALLEWDSDQTVSTPYTLELDAAGLLYIDVTPA